MPLKLNAPTGDFLAGQSVPLFIPSSVRREWGLNGRGHEAEFSQILGYEFDWGQIIEEFPGIGDAADDRDCPPLAVRWHFLTVDVHNAYLDAGGNLGELSDVAIEVLEELSLPALVKHSSDDRSDVLPDYIDFDEGNTISAFAIDVLGAENVDRARKWVDSFFIPGILPLVITYLRKVQDAAPCHSMA
jgi:hypothetical protein